MFLKPKKIYFAPFKNRVMAVTRLKRKERVNKTVSKQRTANLKLHGSRVLVASPYKEESGIILDYVPGIDK